jgi:hypothetical protein
MAGVQLNRLLAVDISTGITLGKPEVDPQGQDQTTG